MADVRAQAPHGVRGDGAGRGQIHQHPPGVQLGRADAGDRRQGDDGRQNQDADRRQEQGGP